MRGHGVRGHSLSRLLHLGLRRGRLLSVHNSIVIRVGIVCVEMDVLRKGFDGW